jgi:hypothetical protein
MKMDNIRQLQAMRDEVKAKIETNYMRLENEAMTKNFNALKELSTVQLEKHKLNCQFEANQKMKVI